MSQHCCHEHDHAPRNATPELAGIAATAEPRWSSLRIDAMDCPTEERLIRDALGKVQAIEALEFNLMQRLLRVRHRFDDGHRGTVGHPVRAGSERKSRQRRIEPPAAAAGAP